jgi:L-lactate dehydrogenase complex protein LldG
MINFENNSEARDAILGSIRSHLTDSTPHNAVHNEIRAASHHGDSDHEIDAHVLTPLFSVTDLFRDNLETVDGRCIVAAGEIEVVQALKGIISSLRDTPLQPRRIAISDAPFIERLANQIEEDVEEIGITPSAAQLFGYDLGITAAQAAIAETGTLVLDSNHERHRLVSLLPPVHVAIIEASQICLTLGEALAGLQPAGGEISPTITLVTGPSRTADIELTLAIGVHGPQKLFVIVNTGPALG